MARASNSSPIFRLIVLALAIAGTASFLINTEAPRFISVRSNSDSIIIRTDALSREQARFYSYRDPAGEELRFILGRDSSGGVHAAMDACQRCYNYHRGYIWSHGYLVCKVCGNRYKLQAMESGLASCVPAKLPIQVTSQSVKIKAAELERQRGLF